MERRKHNTLEKTLNSLHKDEGVILQMIATSSTIQYSHTELDNTLQSLLASLKIAIAKKKQEIDSLPQDSARVELLSHEL
jgi:DNA-binding HxlR family transcriptional regulator